jgi:hypothetical protein
MLPDDAPRKIREHPTEDNKNILPGAPGRFGDHARMVPHPMINTDHPLLTKGRPLDKLGEDRTHPFAEHPKLKEHAGSVIKNIVAEMVKPQEIKSAKAPKTQRSLAENMPPKMMTPHGMMIPAPKRPFVDVQRERDGFGRGDGGRGDRALPCVIHQGETSCSHSKRGLDAHPGPPPPEDSHHEDHHHDEDKDHHDEDKDHHDEDKDHHDEDKDHHGEDKDNSDAGTQTDPDTTDEGSQTDIPDSSHVPAILQEMELIAARAKELREKTDLSSKIEGLKAELSNALEEYKETHGESHEDEGTDDAGNVVVIVVRIDPPPLAAVADAMFAGTGSGDEGEFLMSDWENAVTNTQEMCAEDYETLCGDGTMMETDSMDSSDSSDSSDSMDRLEDHHHWFRRLFGGPQDGHDKNGPPSPPPHDKDDHEKKHDKNGPPPPHDKDGHDKNGPPPPHDKDGQDKNGPPPPHDKDDHGKKHDKNGPPPPPPRDNDKHHGGKKGRGGPPPPRTQNDFPGGPLGFGSRENDMCLKSQREYTSIDCHMAIAETEAIYRDLKSRGMTPTPPGAGMGPHTPHMFGVVFVLLCCLCCLKGRRCHHRRKLKMKRTLAALASKQDIKSALEDAAGTSLPSPGWKQKVALALEANPELKEAIAQVERDFVADDAQLMNQQPRIRNPFTGSPASGSSTHHHQGARCVCLFFAVLVMLFCFLPRTHSRDGPEQGPPPPREGDSEGPEDGHDHHSLFGFFLIWFILLSCTVCLCRVIKKKCAPRPVEAESTVAVDVETVPNIVPSTVASATVTSVTMKFMDMEKGSLKEDIEL